MATSTDRQGCALLWNRIIQTTTNEVNIYNFLDLLNNDEPGTEDCKRLFDAWVIDILYEFMGVLCNIRDAIPVSNINQKNELEHLGKRCIIVSKTIQRLMERKFGKYKDIKASALDMGYEEVFEYDRGYLDEVMEDIQAIYWCATMDRIKVCRFNNADLCGLHGIDGYVYVNKDILNDYKELLITLAHEFAHDFGDDGSKIHLEAVQSILAEMVKRKRI